MTTVWENFLRDNSIGPTRETVLLRASLLKDHVTQLPELVSHLSDHPLTLNRLFDIQYRCIDGLTIPCFVRDPRVQEIKNRLSLYRTLTDPALNAEWLVDEMRYCCESSLMDFECFVFMSKGKMPVDWFVRHCPAQCLAPLFIPNIAVPLVW